MVTKIVKLARDVEIVKAGKTDRLVLHYTALDGSSYTPGTPDKIGALAVKLDPESLGYVKVAKAGQVFNIEMTKDDKYWNLTKVSPGSSGTFAQTTTQQPKKEPFDNVGVKVGAARNQAIAFLAATKGTKFTWQDVTAEAYKVVADQQEQEDAVRAGNNPATVSKTPENTGLVDDDDDFFTK